MRLIFAVALTISVGVGAAFAASSPHPRKYTSRQAARRTKAERMCKAQGPRCRVVSRPDQPRDLTGISCVCD